MGPGPAFFMWFQKYGMTSSKETPGYKSAQVLRPKLALDPAAKVCKSIFLLKTVEVVAKYNSVCRDEWLDGDLDGRASSFITSLNHLRSFVFDRQ
jgi:hypothetical protein